MWRSARTEHDRRDHGRAVHCARKGGVLTRASRPAGRRATLGRVGPTAEGPGCCPRLRLCRRAQEAAPTSTCGALHDTRAGAQNEAAGWVPPAGSAGESRRRQRTEPGWPKEMKMAYMGEVAGKEKGELGKQWTDHRFTKRKAWRCWGRRDKPRSGDVFCWGRWRWPKNLAEGSPKT
jgi:hypothetical protein